MMKWRSYVAAAFMAVTLGVGANTTPASAAFINGQFSMSGTDIYDLTANTITFIPGSTTVAPGTSTGDFAALGGAAVTWLQGLGVPVNYSTLTGGLFTVGGFTFALSGFASFAEGGGNDPTALEITGTGLISAAGFDPTQATFRLTTQGGGSGQPPAVTFSATTVAVPGPIVGAGLPALVLACGGLVALSRRRRNRLAA